MKTTKRQILEEIQAKNPGAKPTMSTLVREQLITSNKVKFDFDFTKKNAVTVSDTEVLLESGEMFYVAEMALGLAVVKKAAPGTYRLFTYPNAKEISKAWAGATFAAGDPSEESLQIFYNSVMSAQFEQEVIFQRLHTSEFLVVPQTQLSAINDANQQNPDEIFREIQPRPVLEDGKKTIFSLNLNNITGLDLDSNNAAYEIRLVLMARGFLVNASDVKRKA